jgi:spore coat protein SA
MSTSGYGDILPNMVGAIEPYAYDLSRYLSFSNSVYLLGRGSGTKKIGNLSIETFDCKESLTSALMRPLGKRLAFQMPYSLFLFKNFISLNKNRHIDILHVHDANSGFIATAISRTFGTPWVCSIHNHIKSGVSLKECDKILAVSNYMRDYLINQHKIKQAKIAVLPIAVDPQLYNRKIKIDSAKKALLLEKRKILLFVGRKCREKGPDVIIDALPKIVEHNPEVIAIFIGPDFAFKSGSSSYTHLLKNKAQKLHLEKNVKFQDYVSYHELELFFEAADLLIFPSIWQEPFGKVLLEAMSYELPIIASAVGAVPEIIQHDNNGLLFSPGDSNALSDAVNYLLNDTLKLRKLAINGRQTVLTKYSFKKISVDCLKIYSDLTGLPILRP